MSDAPVRVSRIEVFPIKSLDGVRVTESAITAGGILENDRVYAIVDEQGNYVNGKRTAQIHRLRCSFDERITEVELRASGESTAARFSLTDRAPIHRWLTKYFGFPVTLQFDPLKGFPDDPEAFGPTLVGEGSLMRVQEWFVGLSLDGVRRRFRTNVEVTGGVAFWEDRLFGAPDERRRFRVGAVELLGHNPCQRCVVPTRDAEDGETIRGFQKTFASRREQELSAWADRRRFNHFYRFAVNTSIPFSEAGKRMRVGDTLDS